MKNISAVVTLLICLSLSACGGVSSETATSKSYDKSLCTASGNGDQNPCFKEIIFNGKVYKS